MATISASENPDLVQDLLDKAMSQSSRPAGTPSVADTIAPWDNTVALPGGYITPSGDVLVSATVRELTGRDEEALGKIADPGPRFLAILARGVETVGGEPVTQDVLDWMLIGDREALMLGIYRATFGPEYVTSAYCGQCEEVTQVTVDVNRIPIKRLSSVTDREFTVKGRRHTYTVYLPVGVTQKSLFTNMDKPLAELITTILVDCVKEIDGLPVATRDAVLDMGVADRQKINSEINDRAPGPQVSHAPCTCSRCGSETETAVSIGEMFRL